MSEKQFVKKKKKWQFFDNCVQTGIRHVWPSSLIVCCSSRAAQGVKESVITFSYSLVFRRSSFWKTLFKPKTRNRLQTNPRSSRFISNNTKQPRFVQSCCILNYWFNSMKTRVNVQLVVDSMHFFSQEWYPASVVIIILYGLLKIRTNYFPSNRACAKNCLRLAFLIFFSLFVN